MTESEQQEGARLRGLELGGEAGPDRTWILLILLTFAALLLRLYRIGEWSLWEDEVFTLREVNQPFRKLFSFERNRYPLLPILQRLFLPLIPGMGEGSLRLLPALVGTLNIPALYLAGRGLVGRAPALLAGLFLALSPWHIYWSQNCRYYTLVSLFAILSVGTFWWVLRKRSGAWAPLLALGPASLAFFSHPSAAFVVAAFGGYMLRELVVRRGPSSRRARGRALRFVLVLALAGLLVLGMMRSSLVGYLQAKAPNPFLHLPSTLAFFIGLPLLSLAAISWLPLRDKARDNADLLFLLLLVPFLSVAAFGFRVRASAQYLFYTLPFFCLLGAWGALAWARLGRQGRSLNLIALAPSVLVLVPLMGQTALYFEFEQGWRPAWREAARFVAQKRRDGDLVAVANCRPLDWYLNPIFMTSRKPAPTDVISLESWNLDKQIQRLLETEPPHRSWVVVNPPLFLEKDPAGRMLELIRREFRLAAHFPGWCGPKDLSLFVYVRERPALAPSSSGPAPQGDSAAADGKGGGG